MYACILKERKLAPVLKMVYFYNNFVIVFIVFYVVIGTLSHATIILELLLQDDKAKAFSLDHPPDAHQERRGRVNKKGKGI